MILRRPTPPPTTPAAVHDQRVALSVLAAEVRIDRATALITAALSTEADRPSDLRNRELIDLCLDLRSALAPAPPVPVVPGRS